MQQELEGKGVSVWRKLAVRISFLSILCIGGGMLVEYIAFQDTVREARSRALADIGALRTSIERRINSDVQRVRGLVGFVRGSQVITREEFDTVARYLVEGDFTDIRNLGLAKGYRIAFVYPYEGNEAAIGLDYRENALQWPMVEEAVRTRQITLAGPLELVQGGTALVARFPIFVPDSRQSEDESLWGIASMVIDFVGFMEAAGFPEMERYYDISVWGTDGSGRRGAPFWGNADGPIEDPVSVEVLLPQGKWVIDGTPKGGWPTTSHYLPIIVITVLVLLGVGLVIIIVGVRYEAAMLRAALLLDGARREALDARDEAERSSRAKTMFLANMSHELRTPLNAIIGFSQIMSQGMLGRIGNEKYEQYVDDILISSRHLLALISDILDITRVESGEIEVRDEETTVSELVSSAILLIGEHDERPGATIDVALPEGLPAVRVDPRLMRQALVNVIGNAVKYTPRNGTVSVDAARRGDGGIDIRVSDTGPGIPEKDIERVLEPFVQLQPTADVANKGAGLGLPIAKRLLEAHGGILSIGSLPSGGTRVVLTLPRGRTL